MRCSVYTMNVAHRPLFDKLRPNNITNNVQSTNTCTHIRNIFHPYCTRCTHRACTKRMHNYRRHQMKRCIFHLSNWIRNCVFFRHCSTLSAVLYGDFVSNIYCCCCCWTLNVKPSSLEISLQPDSERNRVRMSDEEEMREQSMGSKNNTVEAVYRSQTKRPMMIYDLLPFIRNIAFCRNSERTHMPVRPIRAKCSPIRLKQT